MGRDSKVREVSERGGFAPIAFLICCMLRDRMLSRHPAVWCIAVIDRGIIAGTKNVGCGVT